MHTKLGFQLAIVMGFCMQTIIADCPRLCECKWKSGKESVFCLNSNLSSVPNHLEAGTQVLDLTGNNLVTVRHDEFSKADLLNLQKVYISKCRLKNLERYAFRKLINLVELDLSYNTLANVPSHTFDSIPELRELKLNGNPIQIIHNDAFINIPQLIRLELSDCRATRIEVRAFFGLDLTLEWLKLDKNKLSYIDPISFTILKNLHGLELAGNPWNCTCQLRPLRDWMLRQNVPSGIPPVCHNPERLNRKTWDKLDLDEFACLPEIIAHKSKTYGVEGLNVTMTCQIAGIPEPSVRWLIKNKVIANLSSHSNGKKLYMVRFQNQSSDLTIFSADLQDAGVYICAAENKAGRAEAIVTLAVIKKIPETLFNNKILVASILTGIALGIASCFIALCVYLVRRKKMLRWQRRDCRRENNYEKIELNHKAANNSSVKIVKIEMPIVASKKNGDYRVVPAVDLEPEEEDEETTMTKKWNNSSPIKKLWNSPRHLLDPGDLHIPRRSLHETRPDLKNDDCLMSGIYNNNLNSQTSGITSHTSTPRSYVTTFNIELPSLMEDNGNKKYPDIIENPTFNKFGSNRNSESCSVADITELFCTLPRKRALIQSLRYQSNESQSPLLTDSRYGSSGGESNYGSQESSLRQFSDCAKSGTNLNRNRMNKTSNSYLNLTHDDMNSTPLLDVFGLENRVIYKREGKSPSSTSATATITPNANSYDYHASQLERFLEEYRSLQEQLTKMKESCDNLRTDQLQAPVPTLSHHNNVLRNTTISPNSNQSLEDSIDFKNFESELTKYLLAKKSSQSSKSFNHNSADSAMFNN